MRPFFSLCTLLCLAAIVPSAEAQEANRSFLRAKLYNANNTILDGNIVAFDDIFSNDIDGYDAAKLMNPGENFAMMRNSRLLSVEARKHTTATDTIFYDLSRLNLHTYQIKFTTENFPVPCHAVLVDAFTNTNIPIHTTHKDSSFYSFTVNSNPATAARNRLMLIISILPQVIPVQLQALSAVQTSQGVIISWKASNEVTMQYYEVESSRDGTSYESIGKVAVKNEAQKSLYEWVAPSAAIGFSTYRIKAVNAQNTITYSSALYIDVKQVMPGIKVLAANKLNVTLQFENQQQASYRINLYNAAGQPLLQRNIKILSQNGMYNLALPQPTAPGIYFIEAINTINNQKTKLRFAQF